MVIRHDNGWVRSSEIIAVQIYQMASEEGQNGKCVLAAGTKNGQYTLRTSCDRDSLQKSADAILEVTGEPVLNISDEKETK